MKIKQCFSTTMKKLSMVYKDQEDRLKAWKRYYHNPKNREYHKGRQRERKQARKAWFEKLKSTMKCCRCGESEPCCLDFHHKDPTDKTKKGGGSIDIMWSKERILEEISKCEILCCNCHRKEHWGRSSKG